MAHKLAAGSSKNGRDSRPKYLGVKLYEGQTAKAGSVLIRQRGTKFRPGVNVGIGSDHTIFAIKDGIVKFANKKITSFTGQKVERKIVSVL